MESAGPPVRSGRHRRVDELVLITCNVNSQKAVCIIGENLNLCWSPDGSTVAVGNKDDLVSFIDIRTHKSKHDEQFKFEVNEISWNNDGDLFFLTSGPGALHIYRFVTLKCTDSDILL